MGDPNSEGVALDNNQISSFLHRKTRFNVRPYDNSDDKPTPFDNIPAWSAQIINTAKTEEAEGEHWVIYVTLPKAILYFDSLGLPYRNKFFNLLAFSDGLISNSKRPIINVGGHYQYPKSAVCGEYVCCFAYAVSQLYDSAVDNLNQNWLEMFNIVPANNVRIQKENDRIILKTFIRLN